MSDGRVKEAWGRQSALLAMLANCHRDQKRRTKPYEPRDFDPTIRRQKQAVPKVGIGVLRDVFVRPNKRTKR